MNIIYHNESLNFKESRVFAMILNEKITLGDVLDQTERIILKLAKVKPEQIRFAKIMNKELADKILKINPFIIKYISKEFIDIDSIKYFI